MDSTERMGQEGALHLFENGQLDIYVAAAGSGTMDQYIESTGPVSAVS